MIVLKGYITKKRRSIINEVSKAAISGAKWTTFSTIALTVLQFGQVTVLARILTPTEFGLVGMVTILINLLISSLI